VYAHDINCPTNPWAPEPPGICQRCGHKYYLRHLDYQWDYNGPKLANRHIRVCPQCLDQPADQNRPPLIKGREGFVADPRPPNYEHDAASGGPAYPSRTGLPTVTMPSNLNLVDD
jgi:hypothetical protein